MYAKDMVPENIETGSNYEDIGRWQYPKFIRFWLSNCASAFVVRSARGGRLQEWQCMI